MKRKMIAAFLIFAMLFTLMPTAAMAVDLPEDWGSCTSCSEDNPHMIETKEDLDKIRTHLVTEIAANRTETLRVTGYFKLANDIIFNADDFAENGAFYNNGKGFEPIGVYQKTEGETKVSPGFHASVFDGNNYKIKGLKIDNDGSYGTFTGLFAWVRAGSVIKNLTLEDCSVTNSSTTGQQAGVLAGYVHGELTKIQNCSVINSSVTNTSETSNASNNGTGAIAGRLCTGPTVIECNVDTVNVSGLSSAGGIAGVLASSTINNCIVTDTNIKGCLAGSFVGNLANLITIDSVIAENISIELQNTNNVSKYATVGGAVGYGNSSASVFKNCFIQAVIDINNVVEVADTTNDESKRVYVGGMVGREQLKDTFENCYVDVSFVDVPADKGSTCFVANFAATPNQASETYSSSFVNCVYVENDSTIPALISAKGEVGTTTAPVALHKNLNLTYGTKGYLLSNAAVSNSGVVFTSDDTGVVAVDSDGTLTPVKAGTANITAEITIGEKIKTLAKTVVTVEAKDVAVAMENQTVNYDGAEKTITATVENQPDDLVLEYSYKGENETKFTKIAPVEPGTYTVKVESNHSGYALAGTTEATLTINAPAKTDVSNDVVITEPVLTYDNTAKAYTAVHEGISSWTYTYYDANETKLSGAPVNSGNYKVVIVGDGDGSYAVITKEFSVTKATPALTLKANGEESLSLRGSNTVTFTVDGVPTDDSGTLTVVCDNTAYTPASNGDGTFTVSLPNKTADYTFTATVIYDEDDNYNTVSAECTVSVTRKTYSSSDSGSSSTSTKNDVSVDSIENGSIKLSDDEAKKGETVTATVTPDKGYGVAEVIVTDEKGNVIPVTYLGNGEYSFVMPDGKVNIETVCKPAITLTIGDKKANVFGKIVINDVAPIIVDGRTMLPIRFVAEALGADVSWNEDTQTVTITKDGTVVEIIIGADYAYINGKRVELDSPAFIVNGRTYLPVRFVAEALGADVNWDAKTQQVVIMK